MAKMFSENIGMKLCRAVKGMEQVGELIPSLFGRIRCHIMQSHGSKLIDMIIINFDFYILFSLISHKYENERVKAMVLHMALDERCRKCAS